MKTRNLLPALAVFALFAASCGENEIEEAYVEPAPVVETPAPVVAVDPVREEVEAPAERAAEPVRRDYMMGENGTPLMSDEMRYRNMDRGYTAEDFERLGVSINDDMYGGDRY